MTGQGEEKSWVGLTVDQPDLVGLHRHTGKKKRRLNVSSIQHNARTNLGADLEGGVALPYP